MDQAVLIPEMTIVKYLRFRVKTDNSPLELPTVISFFVLLRHKSEQLEYLVLATLP